MSEEGEVRGIGPSRRSLLAGGGLLAALAASAGVGAVALTAESRPHAAATARSAAEPVEAPPPLPPPLGAPTAGVELHPEDTWTMQSFVLVPETGEWFTTQAKRGTSGLIDPAGLEVGDIIVSRLASDGTFLDSMVLPDSGHGMGLVLRVEAGVRVVYSCWFAPDASGRLYDVVRIPYSAGSAARSAATTVLAGSGYPLDPYHDASTDTVTVRHQGGGGPEYTRHSWSDFAAGDLSRPAGSIATPDSPPIHQGFCSRGDRFFFYTGAASDAVGGDPALITEYSWASGAAVRVPLDATANALQPDGTYPGGRVEPEGATIVVDPNGDVSLVVGLTTGPSGTGTRTFPTFRYPFAAA